MKAFIKSITPILKYLKKFKLEIIFILLAFLFTLISIIIFINPSNTTKTEENITINNQIPLIKTVQVDIGGAVIKPDVYEVTSGARLKQVLVLAGGLSNTAHREYFFRNFNLARIVYDQEKIYIPSILELNSNIIIENQRTFDYTLPTTVSQDKQFNTLTSLSANNLAIEQLNKININSATLEELDTLPGIGQATAQKIIKNRPYKSLDELVSKKAMNKNVFENIKSLISIN